MLAFCSPRNAVTSYAVMSCGGVGGLSVSDFGMMWVLSFISLFLICSPRDSYYRFNRSVEFSMIGAAQQGGLSPTYVVYTKFTLCSY